MKKDLSLSHCIWIKNKNIAFVYIPKVACTSWKIFLWQMMDREITHQVTYKTIHNSKIVNLPYVGKMQDAEKGEFLAKVKNQEIECCTMIREPKARVLSAYLDKILFHKNPESSFSKILLPEIREYHHLDASRRPSFHEFLAWNRYISIEKGLMMNDHWQPMSEILGAENEEGLSEKYAKVWTLSDIPEAALWFQERFNKKIEFPSSQRLGPRLVNDSATKTKEYYGLEELKVYDELYKQDEILYKYCSYDKGG